MESIAIEMYQVKRSGKWDLVSYDDDATRVYKDLAADLSAKYVWKAPYIGAVKRENNNDGTRTYIVSYKPESDRFLPSRKVYTVDIY